MDITGSSDPYVKIKLLDSRGIYKWLRFNKLNLNILCRQKDWEEKENFC